jgi:co-chaperonin GroES (HSP10)
MQEEIENAVDPNTAVEVSQEQQLTDAELSASDEISPETLAALEAARRSSTEILASLAKQLYDIEPLGKWAVVRKKLRAEMQAAGITFAAQERSSVGEVVAVNDFLKPLNVGDLVVFSNFAMEVKDCEELLGEKDLYMVRQEEIYARLKPRSVNVPDS